MSRMRLVLQIDLDTGARQELSDSAYSPASQRTSNSLNPAPPESFA
jgi:hypothetical protein